MFKKLLRYSAYTILGTILLTAAIFIGGQLTGLKFSPHLNWLIGGFIIDIFNTALAAIYVAAILLLFEKEKWQKRLMIFAPVGRMGLTTYLMQSVFGTLIFFGYGLGLIMEIGAFLSLLLAIGIFVIQIILARVWFRYFTQGPFEWLWRNLTYLEVQPIVIRGKKIEAGTS